MRIARIEFDGVVTIAIVDGDQVQPLTPGADLDELLMAAPSERALLVQRLAAGAPVDLSAVRLLSPVQPKTLRDYATFEEHVEGSLKGIGIDVHPGWYEQPVFFFCNTNAVSGHDEPVQMPPGSRRLDFELELAAVIGKPGKDLAPEQAGEHIAGYTLFNDWSARDLMASVMQIGAGPVKGKDFANTLGPWIVTADELEPYRRGDRLALEMHAEVNGMPLPGGGDSSANMSWSFEEIVAYASRGAELRPGDVLAAGTCGGGCLLEYWARTGRDEPPPLRPGDVVTLVAEGIGSLSNQVVAGVEPIDLPRARTTSRRPRPWDALSDS
ncbi:hydroxylase [Amycolatopsis orientalis]|uniref:Hydroxylase n=1 Tax=Amycolatopsis orientalis TaxID=31958 RepID=A0A193BUW3_AMYOR|nr:fumarylacetoacetate hydrolase family protein [Amycolatopsis orientalis]ANN16011.1 hydroxylase [Amycolatopsis orientalis]